MILFSYHTLAASILQIVGKRRSVGKLIYYCFGNLSPGLEAKSSVSVLHNTRLTKSLKKEITSALEDLSVKEMNVLFKTLLNIKFVLHPFLIDKTREGEERPSGKKIKRSLFFF